jgi:branched-subunit amino acid aminotransferase/4-amino-4-deoxychorismate lyase
MLFHPALTKAAVNGVIVPLSEARLSLVHPIFSTSFGVYESIQIEAGRPFHLTDHLIRLQSSAELINLVLPTENEQLHIWANRLMAELPPLSYSLQVLAIGEAEAGLDTTVAFIPRPITTYDDRFFSLGVGAIIYPGSRYLPQSKTMNTLVNHLSRTAARQQNALEAILVHQNCLMEGARSNLFVVHAETRQLLTPPADQVLSGVTREIVLKLMKETDHPVIEAEIKSDTPLAEMFITSTSMHVMPITRFNGKPVGDGLVGPITHLAHALFEAYYRDYFR